MPNKVDKETLREYHRIYQQRWRKENPDYRANYAKGILKRGIDGLLDIFTKNVQEDDYFFLVDDIVEDLRSIRPPYVNNNHTTHRGICRRMYKYIPEVTRSLPLLKEVAIHYQAIEAYKRVLAKNKRYKNMRALFYAIRKELPKELEKRELTGIGGWEKFIKLTKG